MMMTSLLEVAATANCRRSSFSGGGGGGGELRLPVSAVCGQTTLFRPVVVAAGLGRSSLTIAATSCDVQRPSATSDDESPASSSSPCGRLATRKRRHDDDSSDDALASDDDEEIRTIFCGRAGADENDGHLQAMTSRAPDGGAAAAPAPACDEPLRHCSVPPPRRPAAAAAAVSDCGVVHRPSLNLYKMQVSPAAGSSHKYITLTETGDGDNNWTE